MLTDSSSPTVSEPLLSEHGAPAVDAVDLASEAASLSGLDWFLVSLQLVILFLFVSSIMKWISLLRGGARFFGERAIVPVRARARPHWNPLYFIFFFAVLLVANMQLNQSTTEPPAPTPAATSEPTSEPVVSTETTATPLTSATPPPISVTQLLMSSASMVTATLATMWLVLAFCPHVPKGIIENHDRPRVGWLARRGDISLGFGAAWLILPPTMMMMAVVSLMQTYSHPVLEALKPNNADSQPDLAVFAALFFSTAIITPLVEEFWFRGMLQGGLQRIADTISDARRWSTGSIDTENQVETDGPPIATELRDPATRTDWTPTAIWPIVVTSLIFAVMHWGQGLAPVALFFLSLGLGYLYRQTGSLVPSITVHFVLNGFTMCVTLLELLR